jgi:putative membrane protein
MFAPDYFENWLVYYLPLLAFLVSFGIAHHPVVIRLCSKQAVRQKNVEILARALFQKGGIHHTRAKTGMLIFCSNLEKICYLLPDRGVEMAIPADEWQILRQDFQGIYADKNPYAALITQLNSSTAVFSRYLPAQENDINELPDALDIQL